MVKLQKSTLSKLCQRPCKSGSDSDDLREGLDIFRENPVILQENPAED